MTTAAPTLPTLMARPWVVTLAGMLLPIAHEEQGTVTERP